LSQLTPSQLINLNQNALNELVPQRPLIEDVEPISSLRAEYESGSAVFLKQIDWLDNQGFHRFRRARGDGDCFYRALAFAYVEQVLQSLEQDIAVTSALSLLDATVGQLEVVGFDKLVYEDFYMELYSLVNSILKPDNDGAILTAEKLLAVFQDPPLSNSIVAYLRLLTSSQLRLNEDEYSPFIFHPEFGMPMNVRDFCENFVEGSGKEADHVQMTAICSVLQLNVKVAYLDGRETPKVVEFVEFKNASEEAKPYLTLLYRPGHYDILMRDAPPYQLE
ncbi:hypothetical protein AMATHDRAFT_154758, partial [Amanita thiersii Skay4041]